MELHEQAEVPFIVRLFNDLKKREFISSGIMLPLVIGAYKVKENFQGNNYLKFIEHVYNDIIESLYASGQYLYFRECEASRNFVLEPVNKKPHKCNAVIVHKGVPIIYCSDPFLENNLIMEANDRLGYFLNKLLAQTVKYCNFIDTLAEIKDFTPGMHELNELENRELDVIKSILSK